MSKMKIDDAYPLTPVQEGLLFHSLYAGSSGVFVTQVGCRIEGLDVAAFEHSWNRIVQRHAALRTAFVWNNVERPLQVVMRRVEVPFVRQDWRRLSGSEQERRFEAYLSEDRTGGFKLNTAPLMRLALFQLGDDAWKFVWTHHHLLLDGWSQSILLKEVFTLYESGGNSWGPPPRFRDYVEWVNGSLSSESETYWRAALKGFINPLAICRRNSNDLNTGTSSYRDECVRLSGTLTAGLRSLCRSRQLTLNTLVQGAWALVLSRYTAEQDVVFGATVSGRSASLDGIESMVGLFINTLPVRATVSGSEPLVQWLARLQEQQAESRQFEHCPLLRVQEWSEVPASIPLFDNHVVFENFPMEQFSRDSNLSLRISEISARDQSNYPVALVAVPGPELVLLIRYDSRRCAPALVNRMLLHLEMLLEAFVVDPDRCLDALPGLSEHDRRQLLVEWPSTGGNYQTDGSVGRLFEAQAGETPDRIALIHGDEQITYEELNSKANRLAYHLKSLGVGMESPVAICVERSIQMVVGLLAVLKAGGTYVPLDPAYPRQRLAYMLEWSAAAVVLTDESLLARIPDGGTQAVCLNSNFNDLASHGDGNPEPPINGDSAAYVIFTSGSTGQPKGVIGTHRGIVNRLRWMWQTYPFESGEACCLKTSLSFVDAVWELFGPLLQGVPSVIAPVPTVKDPRAFLALLSAHDVTRVVLVPSYLEVLLNTISEIGTGLAALKACSSSGEALSLSTVRRFKDVLPGTRLLNLYGSSEVAADVTCCDLDGPIGEHEGGNIGRAIGNTQIYILNGRLDPVPVYAPGEIYVGGEGLARGYMNRAHLTAERFIPNPYSEDEGARLYKTGDVARYLADGSIEFLGRGDHQVKVRGFRIEVGEVESALAGHSAVLESAVTTKDDAGGNRELAAFVVPRGEAVTAVELREYLRLTLPEYMLPGSFAFLDRLPLTPSGKVDRRALSALKTTPASAPEFVAPRNSVEQQLADIWAAVLGLNRIGIHDNFFDLGGHSLRATQVLARLRRDLKVEVSLQTFFRAPTIAKLAECIDVRDGAETENGDEDITVAPRDQVLRLSYSQQRWWQLEQLNPGNPIHNIPVAVELAGTLDVGVLQRSLGEIVRRHEVLRTVFSIVDGLPAQLVRSAGQAAEPLLALPILDLRNRSSIDREIETERLILEEGRRPFDLSRGPLIRAKLLRVGDARSVLLVTIHHIVADGWSLGVLVRELSVLYDAFLSGETSPLPELAIQYADFAYSQARWLQGEVLQQQLTYWKERMEGAPTSLNLPLDKPRPATRTFQGGTVFFSIADPLTRDLMDLSQREGVSLFMTLLTAFEALLHMYSGQDDIVVGTPIANRRWAETEGLIGVFANRLVLRTNVGGDPSFRELLWRVRDVALGAFANQDLPFERLVEEMNHETDQANAPLFQVMFMVQNVPAPPTALPGLTIRILDPDRGTSKFDLSLDISGSESLSARLEYSTDLFECSTIEGMAVRYQRLLEEVVKHPESRISDLQLSHNAALWVERTAGAEYTALSA